MNKNSNLLEFDILPRANFRSTSWWTRNDFNFNRVDPRYETRLIDWTSRIRFSSRSSGFKSTVPARNNSLAGPMHETRRDGWRDAQEEVRIWYSNGPRLLSMSGRCRYVEAEVILDVQAGMCGDVEICNECV